MRTIGIIQAKNLFYKNKFINKTDTNKNVAVHIRRYNSNDNGQTYGYTEDEYFLNAINHIRSEYNNSKTFHIYSQGEIKDFEKFKSDDTIFNLNEKLENTICNLVTSDILVMSKSSLSYVSGLLSNGIVYYLPFWHKKLNTWRTLI